MPALSALTPPGSEPFIKAVLMLQLPNPVQDATYYADVNLKRLLSWLGYTLAITAMTFVLCLLTSGIGFFLFLSIWTIVSFFYRFTEMTARSATLGMRISGLNFVLYKTVLWTGSMCCFTRWAP